MKSELSIFILALLSFAACRLQFVYETFREGGTDPPALDSKGKDLFGEYWPETSDLTPIGLKNEYIKGAQLRRHYISRLGFLSPSFDSSEILVFSLNNPEHIMTAYTRLMGLYPPPLGPELKREQFKGSLPSLDLYNSEEIYDQMGFDALPGRASVFPVKTFSPSSRVFALTNPSTCSGVKGIFEKNKKKPEVAQVVSTFKKKYFSMFKEALKLPDNYFDNHKNIQLLCRQFILNQYNKRDIQIFKDTPALKTLQQSQLLSDCRDFAYFILFTMKLGDSKHEVIKNGVSNLIRHLIEHIDYAINPNNENKPKVKYILHSAHLSEIGSLLYYLKLSLDTNLYFPAHGLSLLLEVHLNDLAKNRQPTDADYTVKIFFDKITVLKIPYDLFKKKVLALTEDAKAIDNFCGFVDQTGLYYMIAAIILACAFVFIGVWLATTIHSLKNKKEAAIPNEASDESGDSAESGKKDALVNEDSK